MRRIVLGLLVGGLLGGTAVAQVPTASQREAHLAYLAAAASAEGDISSDAAMVMLLSFVNRSWNAAAGAKQPETDRERALLAEIDVLHAQLKARVDAASLHSPDLLASDLGCWPEGATPERCTQRLARLAELAGDNGYFQVVMMTAAWQRGDAEGFVRHARLAAAAPGYRSPYADSYASIHARFRNVPDSVAPGYGTDEQEGPRAGLMAMTLAAAYAMPSFSYSQPCRESEGELRDHCLAIALMQLQSTQSMLEIRIAAGIVEALGDEEDRRLAQARTREVQWLTQQFLRLEQPRAPGKPSVNYDRYFDMYGTDGELAAMRAHLAVNGLETEVPQDWVPASPGGP